ncbi:MAG: LemA family protein [Candidatus Omnitrophica bacterium]|nr:LemA family protein [Candidatus Omnitrophota bacterium]
MSEQKPSCSKILPCRSRACKRPKNSFRSCQNYPDLKANQNFLQLQGRISYLEGQIADRREFYNDSVNTYNVRINQIPDMFVVNMLNMKAKELFKALEEGKKDVEIKFGFPKQVYVIIYI